MYSGQQALSAIDSSLRTVRSQVSQLDYDLESLNRKMLNLRQQESATYRQLAQVKLSSLQANQLTEQLDYAEKQALQLLFQRDQKIEQIAQAVEKSQQLQSEQDAQRLLQASQLDQAIDQLESLIKQVHSQLADDHAYNQQQIRAQDLIDMSNNARLKTEQAQSEQESKGQPYKDDKIFMYLWQRHYGTKDYSAGFISRYFDKKLADHIKYDRARINFYNLNNIPKRLAEHSQNLRQEAEDEMSKLDQLERQAELNAGAKALEDEVAVERDKLTQLDQAITEQEEQFSQLVKQRESYHLGKDQYISRAINVLVDSFKADPIPQLRAEARQTPSEQDDIQVSQLANLRQSKQNLQADIEQIQSNHRLVNGKLNDLKELRRKFKRSDYDARNSGFKNGDSIPGLLQRYLANQFSAKDLWRTFKKTQRFIKARSTPRYGGLGLPGDFPINIPSRGSSRIRIPRGIRFPSGWGGGGGSSGGGGGFKTGGGF